MRRLLLLSSFLSIILLSACDPGESNPGDDVTHCDDTRCYTLGMAFECSEDGRQLYQYIDPTDHLMTEIYKSEFVNGTNRMIHNCSDGTKCMVNDAGFGGCFRDCGKQKTGQVSWCEAYPSGEKIFTETMCELIDGQYVYNDEPHYIIDSEIYSTAHPAYTRYCPAGRECNDDTGCVYISEKDGELCRYSIESGCINESGQWYLYLCKQSDIDNNYYMNATACDVCKLDSFGLDPYCMEKCDSQGDIKYECDKDGNSIKWTCKDIGDGKTYWEAEFNGFCHICKDGQCVKIPGEGEDCSSSNYVGQCVDENLFLYCEEIPITSLGRVAVNGCDSMKSYFGKEFACMSGAGWVGCGPKDHSFPCNVEGQRVTRCYQNQNPGHELISAAFTYELVCTKLSDGSLQYIIPNGQISSYCDDMGHANACNSGGTDCE